MINNHYFICCEKRIFLGMYFGFHKDLSKFVIKKFVNY